MKSGRKRWRAVIAPVGIPLVCFAVTMGSWNLLQPLEAMSVDLRMRWRLHLVSKEQRTDTSDLVLLAIDQASEDTLGRYGAGRWLSRGPFLDQLRFLRSYCHPSVLAYDIIFKDTQGTRIRDEERISEASLRTGLIADELTKLSASTVDCVSDGVLADLSQLVVEQGNIVLAHGFAGIWEDSRFFSVLGYNFRGGWVDPQSVQIPVWSADGNSDLGGVAYLRDIAIPDAGIHFRSQRAREQFEASLNANLPSPDLWDYAYLGALNIPRDVDGIVRRVPLVMGFTCQTSADADPQLVFVPSFALLSVLLHLGVDTFPLADGIVDVRFGDVIVVRVGAETYRIPIDDLGRMQLNYRWLQSDFSEVSFVRLAPVQNETTADERLALAQRWAGLLRDRIAVVGVTVTGVDVGATPINPNTPLVYVQMTAINDILTRSFLRPVRPIMAWVLMLCLLLGFIHLCEAIRGVRVVLAASLLLLVYGAISHVALHIGAMALPVVAPGLFLVLSMFWVLVFRYFTESRARRRIRSIFSSMVSGSVLSYLEDHPESVSLEGKTTDASVLFSDIAKFTSLSENLSPAELIRLLNTYLTPVTNSVLQWEGYLDKYVGDSVMGVWGAPYADRDHALNTCRSALEQQQIIKTLNEQIQVEYGFELQVRMGINSGEVTAGNMGSERKFQYTVLGDTVNVASRLEPVNRDFGTDILIGEATQRMVSSELETREVCRILVAGRQQSFTVYELLGVRGELDAATSAVQEQYASALSDFYGRNWSRCIATLEGVLNTREDGPSTFLLGWAQRYQQEPPPPEWNGVYVRTEKN